MTQNQSGHLLLGYQPQLATQQHLHPQPPFSNKEASHTTFAFDPSFSGLDFDLALDLDVDSDIHYNSLSSSPISTQSQLSQYSSLGCSPLSAFDSIPTPTVPEGSLFGHPPRQSGEAAPKSSVRLFDHAGLMQAEAWMPNGQLTPRSVGRFAHQRESSRSSMGSNGPVSPYSHNISHPQIAVSDSIADNLHGLSGADDLTNSNHYQLSAKSFPGGLTHDTLYGGLPGYGPADNSGISAFQYMSTAPRRRNDRGLLGPPEHPIGPNRSQPVSVASSITSDSPATPAGEPEEDRRRNGTAMPPVPKLDRTVTDAYGDELYNPHFTITSSSAGQPPISPTSDLFNQRVQAANNQHLSAVTSSPASTASRSRSPFRQESPMANLPMHDLPTTVGSAQMRFGSAQQMREQSKAMRDVQAMQQQIARSTDTSTPQTISPKDAMLEFHEPEGDGNFPLFPQQNANGYNADAINKAAAVAAAAAAASQNQPVFNALPMDANTFNNFLGSSIPAGISVPQQYPFVPQQRPQSAVPSVTNTSATTTRLGSADTSRTQSAHSATPQRPADTTADGGTYTCTYHGCTLRFNTPADLQKHKREGHRQAHGLGGARRPEAAVMTPAGLLNTQAGPHRCDRINPSTGKPCNTVFSRPYDLTRHEHTIHNARKQKVRCDLCTDEKTFSRADALTRHYRVCHPDVDFPGKQRRRGAHNG